MCVRAWAQMPASNRPAVLPDGSYASQTALADTFAGASALGASAAPNLRTLLLAGDFFLGAVVAGTRICQRHQTTNCLTHGPCHRAKIGGISCPCRLSQHLSTQSLKPQERMLYLCSDLGSSRTPSLCRGEEGTH